ncbi:uncharacterized protein LOC108004181 isoform X4 [Apis cerana]|uniref:uncharacterized protein LOC108004181 isoform X4 n=2 Tax=Apis cerana TaxID=7461 RepID=UPI0007E2DA9A|nr:uncharacterized protein LOC108004181 isoform X4 [Apis cerana]
MYGNSDISAIIMYQRLLSMVGKNEILFVGSLLILFCKQISSECRQLTACSCMFSNGQGYDLSPLSNSSLIATDDLTNFTFYYHPCMNIPLGNKSTDCYKGVSLCAVHNNHTFSLGKAEETKIIVEIDNTKPPVFILRNENNSITTIALACCNKLCSTHLYINSINIDKNEYHLILTSSYACKTTQIKGLSTGSILLIYFFILTGIYFIGGTIILKFLRGATGWEMVPNHEFWRNLPSLVKDGVVFTFNCCRLNSYERI